MFRLVPKAVALPSHEQLREEIDDRKRAEAEVRALNSNLERRIDERTATLARSNAALRRFAYVASHDLREPIRTIQVFNELLQRDCSEQLKDDGRKYVRFIIEASDRMQILVDDLLTYARSIDSDVGRTVKRIDVNEILCSVRQNLNAAIQESDPIITHGT